MQQRHVRIKYEPGDQINDVDSRHAQGESEDYFHKFFGHFYNAGAVQHRAGKGDAEGACGRLHHDARVARFQKQRVHANQKTFQYGVHRS